MARHKKIERRREIERRRHRRKKRLKMKKRELAQASSTPGLHRSQRTYVTP